MVLVVWQHHLTLIMLWRGWFWKSNLLSGWFWKSNNIKHQLLSSQNWLWKNSCLTIRLLWLNWSSLHPQLILVASTKFFHMYKKIILWYPEITGKNHTFLLMYVYQVTYSLRRGGGHVILFVIAKLLEKKLVEEEAIWWGLLVLGLVLGCNYRTCVCFVIFFSFQRQTKQFNFSESF